MADICDVQKSGKGYQVNGQLSDNKIPSVIKEYLKCKPLYHEYTSGGGYSFHTITCTICGKEEPARYEDSLEWHKPSCAYRIAVEFMNNCGGRWVS